MPQPAPPTADLENKKAQANAAPPPLLQKQGMAHSHASDTHPHPYFPQTRQFLAKIFQLLPHNLRQFFKFGLVGSIGFLVDAGILTLCIMAFGMGPYIGRLVSFLGSATTTWFLNRIFTFRTHNSGQSPQQEWLRFLVVCAGGFALNYGAYASLLHTQPLVARYPILGVAAGSLAGMFFNYFASKKIVFASKS